MEYIQFEKHMLNIKKCVDKELKLYDLLKSDYFCEMTDPVIDSITELLEKEFQDYSNWIAYYMWDLDFGRRYEPGKVTTQDTMHGNTHEVKDIPLKTIEDLYILLKEELDWQEKHSYKR